MSMSMSMSATVANGPAAVDEWRMIEAAADEYESMELDEAPALLLSGVASKATVFPHDDDAFDTTSGQLDERRTSSRSTSSTSSNAGEDEDADEVMVHDLSTRESGLTDAEKTEEESGPHFSSVSLGSRESVGSATMDDKPPTIVTAAAEDVSRAIMFNRYAHAVPSAQESQSSASAAASAYQRSKELTSPVAMAGPLPLTTGAPDGCCCYSTSCQQQQSKWKDERIHELQRALDLMVDAMAIQQRDMAAQRAFLARQSEQLTKLSVTLHQEKLSLQIERERVQKVMRAATCSPSASASSAASCRPPTPSGSSSRPRGFSTGSSKPKTSMKAVFSTLAGSSSSRTESNGRRCTVSSTDELAAVILPQAAASSTLASSARSASASQLAVVLPVSSRDLSATTSSFRDTLSDHTDVADNVAEFERSVSLSALEFRHTTQQPTPYWPLSSSSSNEKAQTMSDVSLQDSPVRSGSRSATNCITSKERAKGTSATSSGSATASAVSPTSASGSEAKKPSLGDRFRSLRWKPN